jgi:hypothetical protein
LLLHNLDRIGEGERERDQRERRGRSTFSCARRARARSHSQRSGRREGVRVGRWAHSGEINLTLTSCFHLFVSTIHVFSLRDIQMTLWNFVLSFSFYRNLENMTPQFIRSSCSHGLTSCVPNGASEGVSNQRRTLETKKFNSHESHLFHKPLLDWYFGQFSYRFCASATALSRVKKLQH